MNTPIVSGMAFSFPDDAHVDHMSPVTHSSTHPLPLEMCRLIGKSNCLHIYYLLSTSGIHLGYLQIVDQSNSSTET